MMSFAFVAGLAACIAVSAESAAIRTPTQDRFDNTTFLDHVRFLAGEDLAGRSVGSPGLDRAAVYLADAFASLGVRPILPDGGYFQPFESPAYWRWASASRPRRTAARSPDTQASEPLFPVQNVIGAIPGIGPLAGEYVVLGAHYDSVSPSRSRTSRAASSPSRRTADALRKGADDNASGTAGLIELAKRFALTADDPRPRRSLLLAAFSAEEAGLVGSKYFTDHPPVSLQQITAMLNLDMIGRMQDQTLTVFGVMSSPEFRPLLQEVGQDFGLRLDLRDSFLASDHEPFYRKGIPVLHFITDVHRDFHTSRDTIERVDAAGAVRTLDFVYRVVDDLLRQDNRPSYRVISGQ